MIVLLPTMFALCSLFPLIFVWRYSRSSESSHTAGPDTPFSRLAVLGAVAVFLVTLTVFMTADWWPLRWNTSPTPEFGISQAISVGAAGTAALVTYAVAHAVRAGSRGVGRREADLSPRSWAGASAREATLTISSIVAAIWLSVAAVALTATDAMSVLMPGPLSGSVFAALTDSGEIQSSAYPGGAYFIPVAAAALILGLSALVVFARIAFSRSPGGNRERATTARVVAQLAMMGLGGMLGHFLWVSGVAIVQTSQLSMWMGAEELTPGLFGGATIPSVAALICGVLVLLVGTLWCLIALLLLVRTTRNAIRGASRAFGADAQSRLSRS